MKVSEKLVTEINNQINQEFYSGYLYLSMSSYVKKLAFKGIANWLKNLAKKKVEYGLELFDYLIDMNNLVTLKQIKSPDVNFYDVRSLFLEIYKQEKKNSETYMNIALVSNKIKDKTTSIFMNSLIPNQLKLEKNINNILKYFDFSGNDNLSLIILDKDIEEIV